MKRQSCGAWMAGTLGALVGLGLPVVALAQGFSLKPGGNYAIGFQENMAPGVAPGVVPAGGAPAGAPAGRNVVGIYRVVGSTGDQQWYRLRMVVRAPQGGWILAPATPEIWVNLAYAMWVQEAPH